MYNTNGVKSMKQIELLKKAENKLKKANIQDAHIQASLLLQYVLKKTKQQIIINNETEVDIEKETEYNEYINKIINGIPIQYITHMQQFMGLDFYVDKNVLIPQPDTEILVEETIKIIKKIKRKMVKELNGKYKKISVLDLCTGSGAIGVSIAHYCKIARVTVTDISEKALDIAYSNYNKLIPCNIIESVYDENIIDEEDDFLFKTIQSDLFENIINDYDVIVSNPPYIETNVINTLSKQVQAEPHIALDGGEDGLDFYKKILSNAYQYLNKGGYLLLEIGYNQAESVINLPHTNLKLITKKPIKDLGGNDRVIIFQKENCIEEQERKTNADVFFV